MFPVSDHCDGRRFFNRGGLPLQPFSAVPRMMLERRAPWPAHVETTPVPPPAFDPGAAALVTFIGHATFLVQTAAGHMITDPMYSHRAGPFGLAGPRRVRPPAVSFESLPPIAVVLLSHNHYDHCDLPTLRRLAERFDPLVVTPLGNGRLMRSAGLRKVEELDWWQSITLPGGPVTLTPAHHFSARTPFDRNRSLWGGFMMTVGGRRLYFAGDSAYSPLFRDIRQRLGAPDLALLPIGAYEPRWFMQSVHMNPAEAVQAHLDLESRESLGMHFGTFQLTLEAIDEPLHALAAACQAQGVPAASFRAPGHGETARLA